MNTKWFNRRLKAKGASQADLARHLNLDRSAICLVFSGKRRLRIEEIAPIAEFLGVEPIEVYEFAIEEK